MIPAEVESLIIRLLQESYIDFERPEDHHPRFLVDGSVPITKDEADLLDTWLGQIFVEEE